MDIPMYIIWLSLAIILGIAEAVSLGLSSIWFAIGAAAACISAMADACLAIQIAIFFVVSILLLIFTRPIFVNKLKIGQEKTNVEAIVGKQGVVTSDIEAFKYGRVDIAGQDWNASVKPGAPGIIKGAKVVVIAVEGVTVIVEPVTEE